MNKDLKIGQVIYIVSDKSGNVIPAIVAEEVVIRTLQGDSTSWKLFVGPETNRQVIDSRKVTGDVYSSIEEVQNILLERLTDFLNGTLEETRQRVKKWYGIYLSESEKNVAAIASMTDSSGKIDADQLLESISETLPTSSSTMPKPNVTKRVTSTRKKTPEETLREAFGSDTAALQPAIEAQNNDIILKKVKIEGELVDMPFKQIRNDSGQVIELVPV